MSSQGLLDRARAVRDRWQSQREFVRLRRLLIGAAQKGDAELARTLLDTHACLRRWESRWEPATMALHVAAMHGRIEVVRMMLDYGVRPGAELPLLHWAAANGDMALALHMLGSGEDVNAATEIGRTPLMAAACKGRTEVVRLLLDHGADASRQTQRGETALSYARKYHHPDVVEMLLKAGARE